MNRADCIGFIGLGVMGKPMALRFAEAGYQLVVYSRTRSSADDLVAHGARVVESPAEVAAMSRTVITMLPDSPDVEQVVSGPDGVLSAVQAGDLIIDMSTVAPELARRLSVAAAARGAAAMDAPVSGGEAGAIGGTLSIMCGGLAEHFKQAQPILSVVGARVTHVGGPGMGQVVKACNQIMVAATLQAMAEALVLASKAGADPRLVVEVLMGGAARCWALEARAPDVLERNFDPGFRSRLHLKDLGLALGEGEQHGVTLPVTAVVRQLFSAMSATGRGDYDHAGLITIIEDLSGHQLPPTSPPSEGDQAEDLSERHSRIGSSYMER